MDICCIQKKKPNSRLHARNQFKTGMGKHSNKPDKPKPEREPKCNQNQQKENKFPLGLSFKSEKKIKEKY